MSPVVNVRCHVAGCNRLLRKVEQWPDEASESWTDPTDAVWVERCPKHKEIRPRETISDADARRAERGLPPLDRGLLLVPIRWSALRPCYLDAKHRGRDVDYRLDLRV